jgi:hypothetical protein
MLTTSASTSSPGFIEARRFIDPLRAQLRNVDQSFDAFIDSNEHTEIRHAGDLAFDLRADWMAIGDHLPWIGGHLLDARGEAFVLDVDAEDFGFDDITFFNSSDGCLIFLLQCRSEICTSPSMPSSMPTKIPNSVMFLTGPLTTLPTGYFSLAASQGLGHDLF